MDKIKVSFHTKASDYSFLQSDYILFFLVKGHARLLSRQGGETLLGKDDFYLLNANSPLTLSLMKNSLLMTCTIGAQVIYELSTTGNRFLQCDSTRHSSMKYQQLRYLIHNLLGEYSLDQNLTGKKLSILYRIVDFLLHSFSLSGQASGDASRKLDPVFQYVAVNYSGHISLPEAAETIYMTPQSLSRLFRQSMGITFTQYVTNYRLEHAVELLLSTTLPILDIALNSGFSSVSQFNKSFKQKYGMSPGDYRIQSAKSLAQTKSSQETDSDIPMSEILKNQLTQFQNTGSMAIIPEQDTRMQSVNVDLSKGITVSNPWHSTLCLGFISEILNASYQKQLIVLKESLNFEYGYINGLFSPELRLMESKGKYKLYFARLDQTLDFLVEQKIRPMILFDTQVMTLLKKNYDTQYMPVADLFDSIDDFCHILDMLLEHFIARYGLNEVSNWCFIPWYYVVSQSLLGLKGNFVTQWDLFYETIKRRIPDCQIGGCNYEYTGNYKSSVEFYRKWSTSKYVPDFISIPVFPYTKKEAISYNDTHILNIERFSLNQIEQIKNILSESGFPKCPIAIVEWNISFIQRNSLNDMAAKAAIMIKQMSDLYGEVETASYWTASDLHAVDSDADSILNGACGLISADGIYKPSYFAMSFFNSLMGQLVARGQNYIVTKDGLGHYALLLYNNKELNYTYYMQDESAVDFTDDEKIFSDLNSLEIQLELSALEDREYHIRKQTFGPTCGSILDEWKILGTDSQLSFSDLNYLKQKCLPLRQNQHLQARNGLLVINERLQANEIMLVEIL